MLMKLVQEKKTSACRWLKITSLHAKKRSCHYLNQRRYQSRSFPEPKKPLELWARAAPRLGQLWAGQREKTNRKGDFLTVGQNTRPSPLWAFSGGFLRARAEQGGTARLGSGLRVAMPQLGDSRAFVRGPHCRCSTCGLGFGWGWCCYAWPVRAEVQRPRPPLPHWHHLPWGNAPLSWSGGLCSHTGKCSFPADTWWRFHLKSFKWMEANWRHAERSACYQAVVCPYSAMTHNEKTCFSAQNITGSSQIDLFCRNKGSFHI